MGTGKGCPYGFFVIFGVEFDKIVEILFLFELTGSGCVFFGDTGKLSRDIYGN